MWTTKLMVDGVWRGDVAETPEIAAKREAHAHDFKDRVTACGRSGFLAEPGRYHLYVSYACPFAHRVILVHALKRLDGIVGLSVVHPRWNTPDGWVLGETPLSTTDGAGEGFTHLHQAYSTSQPDYTGRVTVPVLWDKVRRRIVSSDSREQVRMLNDAFDAIGADVSVNLFPRALQPEIDALGDLIARDVAAGVYRAGGAETQEAYEAAEAALFAALTTLEARLGDGRAFLHGSAVTASDILLFAVLVRFDTVYHPLFRALRKRLADFAALSAWLSRVGALDRVAATVKPDHIMLHYYDDWAPRNRHIVPVWSGAFAAGTA